MLTRIKDIAHNIADDVVGVRRHLHMHPELSFEERETARYLVGQLQALGIPFQYPVAGTGILATIEGEQGTGPCIALRGDMDALPIQEANDVPYCSQNKGIMHACGHDVHTASLFGAARILWSIRDSFSGTIKLLFQPGEEKLPGGASLMIKEGVLKNPTPRSIIGQHVHPPLAVGKIGMRPGLYMASADELYLTITGQGGHGAVPQHCVDPIAISAQIITALQQLISRQTDPTLPAVLTFGHIASTGGATNIIPNEVKLMGTFRTLDEDWRFEAHRRMQQMASGIAEAMGAQATLEVLVGYPFLKNDEVLTRRVFESAQAYMGSENVVELPMRMTGEDFAFYSQEIPACFYRLGTGNVAKGITSNVHTDTFDVDEDCFQHSTGLMAWLALQELAT